MASILVNTNKKKGAKRSEPEDFMPDPEEKKKVVQSPAEMLHFVKSYLHPLLGGQ